MWQLATSGIRNSDHAEFYLIVVTCERLLSLVIKNVAKLCHFCLLSLLCVMKPSSTGGKSAGKASRFRTSKPSKAKHAGQILSTIDQLRKRKARPNLSRICHMVQRQHKLTSEQTRAELELLVGEKLVVKVDYKGSVSYQNATELRRQRHGEAAVDERPATVTDDCSKRNKTERRVLKAVRNLTRQLGNSSVKQAQSSSASGNSSSTSKGNGVSINQIENWIREKWGADAVDSMDAIKAASAAEVRRGHLVEQPDGSYTLHKDEANTAATQQIQKRGPGRPRNEDKLRGSAGKSAAASESDTAVNNSGSVADSSAPVNSAKSSSQKKFGGKQKVNQSSFAVFSHAYLVTKLTVTINSLHSS